ncbi:hypothetical protein E3N88_14414 [Mikania micrantha]|uniref:Large ribosomal subunit protein bL28m n=1 Tax=Mikania micrantha TaxID=192012 RepID=A0A5N6P1D5_9ASTR|nr:hypothetical protein E3N88_14414 [Mikania micrantha]
MAFRSKEMVKKIMKNIGGEKKLDSGVKESLKKCLPDSKVVMNRANRGIYAGRHIQFGNQVSEKVVKGAQGAHLGAQAHHNALWAPLLNRTRRNWKPNVQDKRLFSYILDRHIRVKVTTHALRCIDKAGGIDEYLLKTPYKKMDTEMGLLWKSKIEKMYQELGNMEVVLFPQEEENKLAEEFKEMRIKQRVARRDVRRNVYGWSPRVELIEERSEDVEANREELVANS